MQALFYCKDIPLQDSSSLKKFRIQDRKGKHRKGWKTVIFDLDETLVHCMESNEAECDFNINIELSTGECFEASMNLRPGAEECLRRLS